MNKNLLHYTAKTPVGANLQYFLKWTAIACVIGSAAGLAGAVFGQGISLASNFFDRHSWSIFLLPVSGLLIVWLYRTFNEEGNKGTNMVIEAISSNEKITPTTGPLIFVSTILTQLGGGSAGREGAALQLGGSLGSLFGRVLKLDEKDKKIAVMCGMSACFGALFGTPLAAGVFSMEVISIGIMYYAALVPCLFASFIGAGIAGVMGLTPENFIITEIPPVTLGSMAFIVLLGLMCAMVSILMCIMLHGSEHLYRTYLHSPYTRILVGSAILVVLTLLMGTRDYNGGGIPLIERCMEGDVRCEAFLVKMLFTAVTLGAGFKGGEIVPTLCVGAAFGAAVGLLLGVSPSLCAACGMAALFVGVTNCPIASALLAFEMFGFEAMPYFSIIIAVSFTLSGYYGLYRSQKFIYSKTKTEFINRKAN